MIGKTRQKFTSEIQEAFDTEIGKPRGVLRWPPAAGKFRHLRRHPARALAHCISHYWMVSWDLRAHEPQMQETLPHPNVQVIFEKDNSVVSGVHTGKFTRMLEGQSHVFGIKFNPGGFRPFLKPPVASLMDRTVPVKRIFGKDVEALEEVLTSRCKESEMIDAANEFFLARVPKSDPICDLAAQIVERIFRESAIKTVDDLVRRAGIGKRSLQRIFREYVGVNPKWVIRRYRLHELLERFHSGARLDLANLALELGYFDQAHLINDFRAIVGHSPTEYRKQMHRDGKGAEAPTV
ncbi:MAG: helix-turn-helix domain-containing protein [Candidatus Acidiferrales bacterium]